MLFEFHDHVVLSMGCFDVQDIYFNDARVIAGDNPALNGLIHIIDKASLSFGSQEIDEDRM